MRFWKDAARLERPGSSRWLVPVYCDAGNRNTFMAYGSAFSEEQAALRAEALLLCFQRLEEHEPGYVEMLYTLGKPRQ